MLLAAGAIARAGDSGVIVQEKPLPEVEDYLSWRSGYLTFRDIPLADAVAEFNRYNEQKIFIQDPTRGGDPIQRQGSPDELRRIRASSGGRVPDTRRTRRRPGSFSPKHKPPKGVHPSRNSSVSRVQRRNIRNFHFDLRTFPTRSSRYAQGQH